MNEKLQEELLKIFEDRFKEYNNNVLRQMGEVIKAFDGLNESQAYKLAQQLKYNTTTKKMINELAKISGKSVEDIKKILERVARENLDFAKTYYEARGLEVPIYKNNQVLQRIVNSVFNISGKEFTNLSHSTGFRLLDNDGKPMYLNIDETYKELIDRCVMAVSMGKETYQQAMRSTIRQLADSGVRKIQYNNVGKIKVLKDKEGNIIKEIVTQEVYSRRLDTSVRQNILDAMRQVSNESQQLFGKEFDADGVEISVHINPAPDHERVQGKQFSLEEFNNFQNDKQSTSYDGISFSPEFKGHDRRSISEYNCYHYIFSIVLGISKPQYTNEELEKIREDAHKTFEYEGKKYTMYEGTQLQRKIETAIREQKDQLELAQISGNEELARTSRLKRTQLKQKYNELCNASGLKNVLNRRIYYKPVKKLT